MSYLENFIQTVIAPQVPTHLELFNRVMVDFDDLLPRAEAIADEEYTRLMSQPVSEHGEDGDGCAELAQDAGQEFFDRMFPLAQSLQNLLTLGLFHAFEQQLFLLHQFATAQQQPRHMHAVFKWISNDLGIDCRAYPCANHLEELRLVANAIKHGEGEASDELREKRLELFQHPAVRGFAPAASFASSRTRQPLAGESIYIQRSDFEHYIEHVTAFWDLLAADFRVRNL